MKKTILTLLVFLSILPFCGAQQISLEEMTVQQLQTAYKTGKMTIPQVTKWYLDRIKAIDQAGPELRSVLAVNPDAMQIAQELEKERKAGKSRGPLHGVPVLLKDNIDTHDKMPTTAGSRALQFSIAPEDSWVTAQLRAAGAIILGKANLSEWANFRSSASSSGWSGMVGQTKNPYVLTKNPCGSSAGSGVSVSANLCMIAIGTETNGSIVCPSNANGVVGIKPTVGLISRRGIIPISETQDTSGPMARTVRDAAIALGALTGIDPRDERTAASQGKSYTDYTSFLDKNALKGKKIGIFKQPLGRVPEVDALFWKAVESMKKQGATFVEIDQITAVKNVGAASYQVLLYEFKDGLNKYFKSLGPNSPIKSIDDLIEFNIQDSIEIKEYDQKLITMARAKGSLDSPEYKEALQTMRDGIQKRGIDSVMAVHQLDAIIAPTGSPAWDIDPKNGDTFRIGSSSPAAQAGYPNITVPMGFVGELPVGISFFGKAWSEPTLLGIAYSYEQLSKHRKAPRFIPN